MSGNEVSGKKGTLLSASQICASAEHFDLFCHPCADDNKHVEARGFCVQCDEYMCRDCVQYHRKLTATKNHVIQDGDSMPKDAKQGHTIQQTKDVCTEPCTKHPGKILEYYCEPHNEFGCSVCVTLGHITCGVGYIPELSKGTLNSEEYGQLVENIDDLHDNFKEANEKSKEAIDETENRSEAYTAEVTQLGEAIIKQTRDLMQRAMYEKNEFVREIIVGLRGSQELSEKMMKEIISMKIDLESKHTSDSQSFILMKKLQLNITEANEALRKRLIDSKPTVFEFTKNPDIKCIQEIHSFGTLSKHKKVVEQLDDISITTESDKSTPRITSLELLSDGRLAMVDKKNKTIKLVDTKDKNVTEFQLQHEPLDLTEVNRGQLAVTLHREEIQFLSVTGSTISKAHLIKTRKWCQGIATHENNLIVSFLINPVEVQIMDMTGRVLRRITTGPNGEKLFSRPQYVAVNPSNNMIYVSDCGKATLTCMTMEGKVNFVYRDESLKSPKGLTIRADGSVYVCGERSILHITQEGTSIQTLLGPGQEGAYSSSIAYDKNTQKIYLGMKSLRVYKLE